MVMFYNYFSGHIFIYLYIHIHICIFARLCLNELLSGKVVGGRSSLGYVYEHSVVTARFCTKGGSPDEVGPRRGLRPIRSPPLPQSKRKHAGLQMSGIISERPSPCSRDNLCRCESMSETGGCFVKRPQGSLRRRPCGPAASSSLFRL